mgnify:CR=1 FL=1
MKNKVINKKTISKTEHPSSVKEIDNEIDVLNKKINDLEEKKLSLLNESLSVPEKKLNNIRNKSFALFEGEKHNLEIEKFGASVNYLIYWEQDLSIILENIPSFEILEICSIPGHKYVDNLFKLINQCSEWDNPHNLIVDEFLEDVKKSKEYRNFQEKIRDVIKISNSLENKYPGYEWYTHVVDSWVEKENTKLHHD